MFVLLRWAPPGADGFVIIIGSSRSRKAIELVDPHPWFDQILGGVTKRKLKGIRNRGACRGVRHNLANLSPSFNTAMSRLDFFSKSRVLIMPDPRSLIQPRD